MKKTLIGIVLSTFLVGMFAFAADAQRRGRRARRPAARVQEAPRSAEIAPALGEIRWGMTREEVLNYFLTQAREKYRPLIAKARDGITEDRLRQQMGGELRRIRESVVEFRGQHSGWDISFLRDEFTHNNTEAMLQVNDDTSQNFYFFINDRLWKWYKAFNASVFAGQEFARFAEGIQQRFGAAVQRSGELVTGRGERRWLEWQDDTTRLRAVDETHFYGYYCLVFEAKETLGQLATLRRNVTKVGGGTHAAVEQVTSDTSSDANANQDIVDRITGKIRNQPSPGPSVAPPTKGRPGAPSPSPSPSNNRDEDPLEGL